MYYNFNNIFAYVNSYEEAKNYPIQQGQTILLVDSSNPYIYMKSFSQFGCPAIKCFEIKEVNTDKFTNANISNEELQNLLKRIEALEGAKNESVV